MAKSKQINWHVEKRKLSKLQAHPMNYRKMSPEQDAKLKESINLLGLMDLPVINTDNTILSGHQRCRNLMSEYGEDFEIDVLVPNRALDYQEQKRALVSPNIITGMDDREKLIALYTPDELEEYGYNKEQLAFFDDKVEVREVDDIPELPIEPKSMLGEFYKLGEHRLLCGDSTSISDIEKLMVGNKARMCFTDPPYNVDYQGAGGSKRAGILNDKMSSRAFTEFLSAACRNIMAFTEGGVYICMSPKELGALKSAFEREGGHWQEFIIWVKNKFTLGGSDYQHQYEPILYGWPANLKEHYFISARDNANVIEDLREVKTIFDGENTVIKFQGYEVSIKGRVDGTVKRRKNKTNIWRYDKPEKSAEHPTMKPVALCTEAIKNSSLRGEIVLDLFGGSGSTLIAAEQLGRICYMNELDPKYCDVIRQRYWKLTHDSDEGWEEGTKC